MTAIKRIIAILVFLMGTACMINFIGWLLIVTGSDPEISRASSTTQFVILFLSLLCFEGGRILWKKQEK